MERKITQISVAGSAESALFMAVATADDGTAWKIRLDYTEGAVRTSWVQLPALPESDQFGGIV